MVTTGAAAGGAAAACTDRAALYELDLQLDPFFERFTSTCELGLDGANVNNAHLRRIRQKCRLYARLAALDLALRVALYAASVEVLNCISKKRRVFKLPVVPLA